MRSLVKQQNPYSWVHLVLEPTISFMIFWDFSMFYQFFLSPQVKRWAIITYNYGLYELPHELPNHLRLHRISPAPSLPAKMKALPIPAENSWITETRPPPAALHPTRKDMNNELTQHFPKSRSSWNYYIWVHIWIKRTKVP